MTAMTGTSRRYGTLRPATRRPDSRRRRDPPWGIAAAVVSVGSLPLRSTYDPFRVWAML